MKRKRYRCYLSNVKDDDEETNENVICSSKKTFLSESGRKPIQLNLVDETMRSYLPSRIPQGKEGPLYYICDSCLPKTQSSLQTMGYFHFTPDGNDIISFDQQKILSNIFFRNNNQFEKKKLISGTAEQYLVFRNIEDRELPPMDSLPVKDYDQFQFYEFLSTLLKDIKVTLKLKNYKMGALEFIRNTNLTKYEKPSQVTHLDSSSNLSENLIGIFLPLLISKSQSSFRDKIEPLSGFQYGGNIGTQVLNNPELVKFSWKDSPQIDINAWKVTAIPDMINLSTSPGKYTAVVVNKIPHRGPPIPAYCERIVMFAYLVPKQWKRVEDLNITIPAVAFLIELHTDEFVNLEKLRNDEYIKAWFEKQPNLHLHFTGDIEWAENFLNNSRMVLDELKRMNTYNNRIRGGIESK